jgi:integrase
MSEAVLATGSSGAIRMQHYALVATLAYTGLRFCHSSALRWEDSDEEPGVLRVVRKHFRGQIGPVSRKKRAPKEYAVEPSWPRSSASIGNAC